MKIVYKAAGEPAEIRDIENTLETMQELIEGFIENVIYKPGIDMWCNDEYNCQGCEELVCDSHIEHYISSLNSAPIDWIVTMENQFGKTVFLTKEEAEAKLEELKGE